MKILYFSGDYTPHDHRFLSALAGTTHDVAYLRLERRQRQTEDRPVPSRIEQPQWAGGRGRFRWRDVPRLVRDLRRVIADLEPDLVHAGPVQTCAFLSVLSGFRPILTMSWGFDLMQDAERNSWWRWVTRYTLRRSSFFTSDAVVTREKAVTYGMRRDRTSVFPWGVDLDQFGPRKPGRTGRPSAAGKLRNRTRSRGAERARRSSLVLFCNRSWEPRYGVDVLAAAFVKAARQDPALSLILLGGGSQGQLIRKVLIGGGAEDRVQFGGQVPYSQLPRWYHMADVFISPSHVDGSSVSLMEALACGIPALVSDIPANREWVREGINGWLYPDGDANALADRILGIALQQGTLGKFSQAARRIAEERADWRRNFGILLKTYEKTRQVK